LSSRRLYDEIDARDRDRIKAGDIVVDKYLLPRALDRRLGISLIIPVSVVDPRIRDLTRRLESLEPAQYYQPFEDFHVTIFDFIKGSEGYHRDPNLEKKFASIADAVLSVEDTFKIELKGIAFSREAGLIKGYDSGKLVEIREALRSSLAGEGLANDERYRSESSHMTFCRFRGALRDPEMLLDFVDEFADADLGSLEAESLDLLEHDWYNSSKSRRIIKSFRLR
jgi:hypothetical protein